MNISSRSSDSKTTNTSTEKIDKVSSDDEEEIDSQCRKTMCEWCFRIVDHIGARRELVEISMNYLDRFLEHFSW